ncbi:hypothetical protein OAA60_05375 [Porticoccaceae bacterium]|nr:hypothetical protein [Porticoccaceae bacterium]
MVLEEKNEPFVANALGLSETTWNIMNITSKLFDQIKVEQEVDEFVKEKVIKIVSILKKYCDIWETQTRGKTLGNLSKLKRFFMQTTDRNKRNTRYGYAMSIDILSWNMSCQNALWLIRMPKRFLANDDGSLRNELIADRNIFKNNFRDLLEAVSEMDKDNKFEAVLSANLSKYKDNNSLLLSDLREQINALDNIVIDEHLDDDDDDVVSELGQQDVAYDFVDADV